MVDILEANGGGEGRQLVAAMKNLDYLHDLTLYAPNTDGEMESLHLHRVVLAAASPYAKAMFKDVWKEGANKKRAGAQAQARASPFAAPHTARLLLGAIISAVASVLFLHLPAVAAGLALATAIHLAIIVYPNVTPWAPTALWAHAGEAAAAAAAEAARETGAGDVDVGTVVRFDNDGDVMDIDSLRAVTEYIYTGAVRVEWGVRLLMLARVADYLGMEGLTERCVEATVAGLQDGNNAVDMLMWVGSSSMSLGDVGWMERVREASMAHVLRHFATLSQTEGFVQQMGVAHLCDVLGRDELRVSKEEEVFEAVKRWMGAAGMGRGAAEAEQVLPLVRFPQMAAAYLTTRVQACQAPGIAGSALLSRLAAEALACRMSPSGGAGWEGMVAVGAEEDNARMRKRAWYTSAAPDATTMECARTVRAMQRVRCMGEVGEWVVSGHDDGSIRVWERGTWTLFKTEEQAHDDAILNMVAWQGMLVTSGNDSMVKVWEVGTLTCAHELAGHTARTVWDVMVLDDSTLLSCSDDCTIRVWDTATWACRRVVDSGHADAARCLVACHGMVYCGGWGGDGDRTVHTVRVLDASTWECVDVLRGHTGVIGQQLVRQNELITTGWDKTIKVWSTGPTPRQCKRTTEGDNVILSMALCGDTLVSGGMDRDIRVWNTDTWECGRVLEGHHTGSVNSVLCTRDGESVVSGSFDGTMRVWRDPTSTPRG